MVQAKGKVYLVGAGPGDVGLLTLRGKDCLAEADAVVYDRLINPELLHFTREDCEKIYVGKAPGRHALSQEEINNLLVRLAREGKKVVRLKGGDPFLFGRGGEEALTLREAGIPFEIVPGVTSAVAVPAYAGIPVTHRGVASTVAIVTGNEDPGKEGTRINWRELARSADTLVFLMGVGNLSHIVGQLLLHGRPPSTPCALIRWGSRAEQETLVGTLVDIEAKAQAASFRNPAVIVVGEVVRLREKLAWWDNKPLAGRRIVVTRPWPRGKGMAQRLSELGAEVVQFPAIKIRPPVDLETFDRMVKEASRFDWIVFTSVNGVEWFWRRLKAQGLDVRSLAGVKIAAIGPATAEALAERGILADYQPAEYIAEAVASGLKPYVKGKRVLLPRADIARPVLAEELRQSGAEVVEVAAYKTEKADGDADRLREWLSNGKIDAVTFTSASTVRSLLEVLGGDAAELLKDTVVACIGPVTGKAAREAGLKVAVEAREYTEEGLIQALLEYFAKTSKRARE
ncbi:MAG: uroporphyrinogen-III C-methyltransferase [Thermanaeromonas sp.]|uniref:uroporphyrinogen-III C-methyltransferase n=1 Tax=Thermanaeromonas sp. TaxID=2003697 RepID=UPI00243FB93A|nr:uroporphyrinogen-III C-methyltransferase [Thermanaeromonas sp.]MCG0277853.1 uroporphyrinogen-III C-methyltransferase [Thermanaeromonas sp.]